TAVIYYDNTVSYYAYPTNAVLTAEPVELCEQIDRAVTLAVDRNRFALFERDSDIERRIRRGLGGLCENEDIFGRCGPGLLKDPAFVRNMHQVPVHRIRLFGGGGHGDAMPIAVGDQFRTALKIPVAPGGYHLDVRLQCVVLKFETDLVVALAGGPVCYGVGSLAAGDLDLAFCDDRPCQGGTEKVCALIDGVGFQCSPDIFFNELFAKVFDIKLGGAGGECLLFEALELLALADVGAITNDLAAVGLFYPEQHRGGVEAAGVG